MKERYYMHTGPIHKKSFNTFLLMISLVLLLSACGRKGDLYLPDGKTSADLVNATSVSTR